MSIIQQIIKNASNRLGWSTKRKIVVIESDDWGSIRMPSHQIYKHLESNGLTLSRGDSKRYNLYDTLAKPDDLNDLYEVLSKTKDRTGRNAVFTPICVVANPDFEKIENGGFQNYFYEPFTQTLKRYYGNDDSYKIWKDGIEKNLFVPQFHGREHLNVAVWMRSLQNNEPQTMEAFKQGCWGFSNNHSLGISFQAAFELEKMEDLALQKEIIRTGLILFEELFGYKATYFVPPNGPFNNSLECISAECGVKYMSSSKIQNESLGEGKTRKRIHWLGQQNENGQIYITRNCFFEPSQRKQNSVEMCLREIESAFKFSKPAVISSHRVNYIGALDVENKKSGLKDLDNLLSSIVRRWPDVEFLTSAELGQLITQK